LKILGSTERSTALILQIAVLCVAKSSKGRPTIDDVFEEIEKAWKNTLAEMVRQSVL
jgi:hypothetical protein